MNKYLFFLAFICLYTIGFAGNFTPGNIVVVRVGDGSATLTSAATAVFLDEYTTSGTLVQSIALPTVVSGNNNPLTMSGKATSNGALTLSPNGNYLALAGFDTTLGAASVTSSTCGRTVALVNAAGVVNTSQGYAGGTAYAGNNYRGAVTRDGSEAWTAGDGSSSTGGTFYLPAGSFTSGGIQISSGLINTRNVGIFDGQLYVASGSVPFVGISSVGTGTPSTSGQTTTLLPGMPATDTTRSPYAFWFFHENPSDTGVDVLYLADDETNAPAGGLYKYSLVGGTWISNGNITNANGLRGLTAQMTCSGAVQLYISDENNIYSLQDNSGYNGALTGTPTTIVSAGANTILHGVAFTPVLLPAYKLRLLPLMPVAMEMPTAP